MKAIRKSCFAYPGYLCDIYAVARPHARSVWRTAADEGLDESQSRPSPSPNRLSQSVSFEVHRCPYVHACSNLHTPGANSLKVGSRYSQRADRLCPQDFQFGSNNGDAGPLFFCPPEGGREARERANTYSSCGREEQEEQDTKNKEGGGGGGVGGESRDREDSAGTYLVGCIPSRARTN